MHRLIKKILILNKKNTILGLLIAFMFATIRYDGPQYYSVALVMCPALLFSFVVGKLCYIEDSLSTEQFLLSMPISKKQLLNEKNLLSFLCILIGIIIANFVGISIDIIRNRTLFFDMSSNILMVSILIIYNSVYIYLNYRYDYSKTQLTPYILLGIMLFLFKYGNITLEISNTILPYIILLIAVLIINYVLFNKLSRHIIEQ